MAPTEAARGCTVRSAELAELAGVTVRTLRHYHQTGLIAEPERRANGYREYTVIDLIRLLRIRRLASLGIPLDRMPALLDDESVDADSTLQALDAELAAQVERLSAQRTVIAHLRAHNAAPDLPPELAPFLAVFAAAPLSASIVQHDRDQSILLAHLAGEEGMRHLTAFYERISAPGIAPAITEVSSRFAQLGPMSTEDDVAGTVELFLHTVGPFLEELTADAAHFAGAGPTRLIEEYTDGALNEQQRDCLARIEAELERRQQSSD